MNLQFRFMYRGMLPGQEKAIRQRLADLQAAARRRVFRRSLLGVLGGLVVGGCTSYLVFSSSGAAAAPSDPSTRATWSRSAATGPLDDLLRVQTRFLEAYRRSDRPDATLTLGAIRLANAVVQRDARIVPTTPQVFELIARRPDVPEPIRPWLRMLEREGS